MSSALSGQPAVVPVVVAALMIFERRRIERRFSMGESLSKLSPGVTTLT
jgi:hypothetical protein